MENDKEEEEVFESPTKSVEEETDEKEKTDVVEDSVKEINNNKHWGE